MTLNRLYTIALLYLIGCTTVSPTRNLELVRVLSLPHTKGEVKEKREFETEDFRINFEFMEHYVSIVLINRTQDDIYINWDKSRYFAHEGVIVTSHPTLASLPPVRILPAGHSLDPKKVTNDIFFRSFVGRWDVRSIIPTDSSSVEFGLLMSLTINGVIQPYQFELKLDVVDEPVLAKDDSRKKTKRVRNPMTPGIALKAPVTIPPSEICKNNQKTACWFKLSKPEDCYLWDGSHPKEKDVTWSGTCLDGSPHGKGTLTSIERELKYPDGSIGGEFIRLSTGKMNYGQRHGKWFVTGPIDTFAAKQEFHFGKPIGRWLLRASNGECVLIVHDKKTGKTLGIRDLNPLKCQW